MSIVSTRDAQYKNTKRENERLKKQVRDLEDRLLNLTEEKVDIEAHLKERLKTKMLAKKKADLESLNILSLSIKKRKLADNQQ